MSGVFVPGVFNVFFLPQMHDALLDLPVVYWMVHFYVWAAVNLHPNVLKFFFFDWIFFFFKCVKVLKV